MAGQAPAEARTYGGRTAEERQARRRSLLLEAGVHVLGSRGWQGTTVTAVCEQAQLTPRYFYESFVDRDALLVAIFDEAIAGVTRDVLVAAPSTTEEMLRATVTAFMRMVTEDRRKGRATFVEALGSEALMRRRIEQMHWFADQLAEQARAGRKLRKHEARRLQSASLIAAGGLIELIIAWLDGELDCSAAQLIADYTRMMSATLAAAVGA